MTFEATDIDMMRHVNFLKMEHNKIAQMTN